MYRIDQCSVFRNTVTVEGWSECEASPVVRYQGRTTISHAEHLLEPGAFRIVAIIWGEQIRHEDISLEFSNGEIIEGPGVVIKHPQDAEYDSILLDFMELTKTGGRILEIGSRARGGHTYYKNLVYPRLEYVGLDIYEGPNVDVIGDAHHLSRYVKGKFDFVISVATFEHLLMPWKVAMEMNKVMSGRGYAFIQSHGAWPLHEQPWDFWRYSDNAWDGIFNSHTGFRVIRKGQSMPSWTVPNYASSGAIQDMDRHRSYLLSGCLVQRVGDAKIEWNAEVSDVYDLNYNHAPR